MQTYTHSAAVPEGAASPSRSGLKILTGFFACAVLVGCASVSPETVNVPVAVRAQPPAELTAPLESPIPVFVEPTDPRASSALTQEGERELKVLLNELLSRLQGWRAWAEVSP